MVQVPRERKDGGKFTCPDRLGHTMNLGGRQDIEIDRNQGIWVLVNDCLNHVGRKQCNKHSPRKTLTNFKMILASKVICQGFPSVNGQVLWEGRRWSTGGIPAAKFKGASLSASCYPRVGTWAVHQR